MTVTVLQRIASTQQISLLLVPAIKGAVYINTHCNYSQTELTKLYNENIRGHPYTFTIAIKILLLLLFSLIEPPENLSSPSSTLHY